MGTVSFVPNTRRLRFAAIRLASEAQGVWDNGDSPFCPIDLANLPLKLRLVCLSTRRLAFVAPWLKSKAEGVSAFRSAGAAPAGRK